MYDPGVCSIIEIKGVSVKAVQENSFFKNQVLFCAYGFELSFLRLSELKVTLKFVLLEFSSGACHGEIVQKAAFSSEHDLLRDIFFPHVIYFL